MFKGALLLALLAIVVVSTNAVGARERLENLKEGILHKAKDKVNPLADPPRHTDPVLCTDGEDPECVTEEGEFNPLEEHDIIVTKPIAEIIEGERDEECEPDTLEKALAAMASEDGSGDDDDDDEEDEESEEAEEAGSGSGDDDDDDDDGAEEGEEDEEAGSSASSGSGSAHAKSLPASMAGSEAAADTAEAAAGSAAAAADAAGSAAAAGSGFGQAPPPPTDA